MSGDPSIWGMRSAYFPDKYEPLGAPMDAVPNVGKELDRYLSTAYLARDTDTGDTVRITCFGSFAEGHMRGADRSWKGDALESYKRALLELVGLRLFAECPWAQRIRGLYVSPDGRDLYIVQDHYTRTMAQYLKHPELFPKQVDLAATKNFVAQMLMGLRFAEARGISLELLNPNKVRLDIVGGRVSIGGLGEVWGPAEKRVAFTTSPPDPDSVPEIGYAAPEVILECGKAVPASGVYSVACMGIELMLRAPFLHMKNSPNQLHQILEQASSWPTAAELETLKALGPSDRAMACLERVRVGQEAELAKSGRTLGDLPSESQLNLAIEKAYAGKNDRADEELARDFFRRALRFAPGVRAGTEELLRHPWLDGVPRLRAAVKPAWAQGEALAVRKRVLASNTYEEALVALLWSEEIAKDTELAEAIGRAVGKEEGEKRDASRGAPEFVYSRAL